ncbi:SDR family NAD(P)-dependent oxidoreductase, partial [Actinomadura sp. BRA 177]|uniref:SDR family NAD(P)-dependent oxidoreductase n=1 Tax=Actinomadura sp. BRA 177 TaxID=2745202 RepID=UPI001C3DA653
MLGDQAADGRDVDDRAAAKTVEINQFPIVAWTQLALKAGMAERGCSLINTPSTGGLGPQHGSGYHNVTKAAALHPTPQCPIEPAPHVRAHCIPPGLHTTPPPPAL